MKLVTNSNENFKCKFTVFHRWKWIFSKFLMSISNYFSSLVSHFRWLTKMNKRKSKVDGKMHFTPNTTCTVPVLSDKRKKDNERALKKYYHTLKKYYHTFYRYAYHQVTDLTVWRYTRLLEDTIDFTECKFSIWSIYF